VTYYNLVHSCGISMVVSVCELVSMVFSHCMLLLQLGAGRDISMVVTV